MAASKQQTRTMDQQSPADRRIPHILTIVLIASLGAMTLNILLPSLQEIATVFSAPYSQAQLMISAYMALTAALQLVIGPISDRYGRRPTLLASLAIFLAGSVICLFAPNIHVLLLGRMVQATVIAGLVLSRAIVRDIVPMQQAASMLGYVTMGMTLAPMIAPIIGGYFAGMFGWQANFVVILVFGACVTLVCIFALPETNLKPATSFATQFRAWPVLISSPRFWGYALAATFGSGVFFAYLGGAPLVGSAMLKMTPTELGYQFAYVGLGYMGGNFLSGRFSMSWGAINLMLAGSIIAATGALLPVALFEAGYVTAPAFFIPMVLVGLGNGMTLPSANAGIVSVRPDLAGAASGLGGALTIGGGSLLSVIGGWVLSPTSGPYPLLAVMTLSAILCLLATLFVRQREFSDDSSQVTE